MTPDSSTCSRQGRQQRLVVLLRLPVPAAARRAAITAFYAFCREVDDVVDEVADPSVAATKLAVVAHRGRPGLCRANPRTR
jgi:phytoene/squalene synthetase